MTALESAKERMRLAKEISLIPWLEKNGYKIENSGSYYRLFSPFRSENVPSMDINVRNPDKWVDRGTGEKGDIVDMVRLLFNKTTKEAIDYLLQENNISLPKFEPEIREKKNIEIYHTGAIESKWLWDYLHERNIIDSVANRYLVELEIGFPYGKYPERRSRVLGFKNDSGGYEMRSKTLKISNSPKNVTTIKGDSDYRGITVYEGFFSFLSHGTMVGDAKLGGDVVVLNSLSFLPQMLSFWDKDRSILGYLDNDRAGDKASQSIADAGFYFFDMRTLYGGHNDLNDMICGKKKTKSIKDILK